jgi:hypothetical protein
MYHFATYMSQVIHSEHSPTLDTVLMVEEVLRDAKQVISIAELKRRLPRQVNHNTLKTILSYLQQSGKITFTPDGVLWTHMPQLAEILAKGKRW